MRDEYFYDYNSTIFAYNDRNYIEMSAKLDSILTLIEDDEDMQDKVLELLYHEIGEERAFSRILWEKKIERTGKEAYSMDEDELKNRLLDMND